MVYCAVDIPENLQIDTVRESALPPKWFAYPAPPELASIGDTWFRRGKSVGLMVPSVIARIEMNVLLNPKHAEFSRLRIGAAKELPIDEGLRR